MRQAYFKYVPLEYGVPIFGGVIALVAINSKLKARKAEKLQNLDESMVQDLVGDEDDAATNKKLTKAQKAKQKKKQQVAQRLKAEKKAGNAGGDDDDDDADDDALRNWAKGGKAKKK